jgi:hypothetical protein
MKRTLFCCSVVVLALLAFAPLATAQECNQYCQSYMSCDESCYVCSSHGEPEQIDNPCPYQDYTTCGQVGMTCGQCAITNTWEEDEEISRTARPPFICGGSETWYHYVNWSVFLPYQKQMRHVTYGTQVCAGVSQTVVVSQYYYTDWCYDFIYPDCDGTYYTEGYLQFDHAMECHW